MVESKAAYARRKGWNRSTVTRFAAAGKLVVTSDGQIDVESSDALLAASSDPLKEGVRHRHEMERDTRADVGTRADPRDSTYQLLTKHRAAAEAERATLLRLEREEKEGLLVDAAAVRKRALETARTARNAVLGLRYRIDPLLAGETDAVKRAEIWDRETRAVCEEIARSTEDRLELQAQAA